MRSAEKRILKILINNRVDPVLSLPCDRIKFLIEELKREFFHIPLTREEEGVGISAGLSLAGRRPAMFVQSSGVGNMINALLSLTGFYQLPLALFISHRGIYKEQIPAQVPIGQKLTGILRSAGIDYSVIDSFKKIDLVEKMFESIYERGRIHAFLLSPALFEMKQRGNIKTSPYKYRHGGKLITKQSLPSPRYTRYEIIRFVVPYIRSKMVVCNLGIPSKELYALGHQPSNFYMLGSMGMVTPVGLGISLVSGKEVIVIDGDGSLLMNPGSLATAAHFNPPNLTIIALDNRSYGSTGGQPTFTGSCVNLASVASGFGIENVVSVSGKWNVIAALKMSTKGMKFIHVPIIPGNADVSNIPLDPLDNKRQVMDFLRY